MTTATCTAVLACIAVSTVCCSQRNGEAQESTGGIFAEADVQEWRIGAAPIAMIGGDDDRAGYSIGGLVGAVITGQHLFIADLQAQEVRVYSHSGLLVARSGREGSGPGEYRAMRSIVRYSEDAIAVWDTGLRRLTVVNADGTVPMTIRPDLTGATSLSPLLVGISAHGHIVYVSRGHETSFEPTESGWRRDTAQYVILEPDGSWRGNRWIEPGVDEYFLNSGTVWGAAPVIFGRSSIGTIADGNLIVGNTDSLVFRTVSSDGILLRQQVLPWRPVNVLDAWVSEEREALLRDLVRPSTQFSKMGIRTDAGTMAALDTAAATRIRITPHRPSLPAFDTLLADTRGGIWVSQFSRPDARVQRWVVLNPDGGILARVQLPAEFDVLSVSTDYVAVRTEDELEREGVALFKILK